MNIHLESWLASATLDLALSERQRIFDEISAHVSDAIAHQTAQGVTQADAEARAVQDLGDPQAARAAFQRTCYTLSDEIRLERLLERSWWTLPYAWLIAGMPAAIVVMSWLNISIPFIRISGVSDATLIDSVLFWLAIIPLYFYEPRIKRWLYKRFPARGALVVQAFTVLLALPIVYSVPIEAISTIKALLSRTITLYFGTGIFVPILVYRWIAQQAPLTLKTIRRTRA